jgi:hypothetical protein
VRESVLDIVETTYAAAPDRIAGFEPQRHPHQVRKEARLDMFLIAAL